MQPRKWANPFDTPTGEPRQPLTCLDFDPVLHAGSARASGRIGNTAWALWERGEGLVLAFQVLGQERLLVPIDSDSEKASYMKLVAALLGAVMRTTV